MSNPAPRDDAEPEITPGHPTGELRVVGDTFPHGATPRARNPADPDPQIITEAEALSWLDDDDDETEITPDTRK